MSGAGRAKETAQVIKRGCGCRNQAGMYSWQYSTQYNMAAGMPGRVKTYRHVVVAWDVVCLHKPNHLRADWRAEGGVGPRVWVWGVRRHVRAAASCAQFSTTCIELGVAYYCTAFAGQ